MSKLVLWWAAAVIVFAQSEWGELRIKVVDQAGLPVPGPVEISSQTNQLRRVVDADHEGNASARRLPFGMYTVRVERSGFVAGSTRVEIRSAIPVDLRITLNIEAVETTVTVNENETLVDPRQTSAVSRIGGEGIESRAASRPGRSLLDLINTQPGWLLEANGVLHPRGSEYQTQYVIDGMPLTENRSPAFSPELEAEDVQSMSILTGGYPAEYGRKLGGVIDVVTGRDSRPGLHGRVSASGGSFDTFGGSATAQYGWNRNVWSVAGEAARTNRYLDPPVEENFTNTGTNTNISSHFERDLSDRDRFGLILRRGESRFEVPNEMVQQQAGQRQDRGADETAAQVSYQHVDSPRVIFDVRGMVRDAAAALWSNLLATPMIASQDRGLREAYVKGTVSAHAGRHEWKTGVEADFGRLRENFAYTITNPSRFDPATPQNFQFAGRAPDREQGAFVQDSIHLGNFTVNAGVRWDHYSLLLDQSAVSPRIGAAWYWPAANLVVRASFDRIFQTPPFENLLSSSAQVESLNDHVFRSPVEPSKGNYYEAGIAKGFAGRLRVAASFYRRAMNQFADDDLLLNTGVSFPIAFRRAEIQGMEVKVEIPRWGPVSGFASWSNMTGFGYLPVTGGLLLGDDAAQAFASGRFPVTQDQRNTVQTRIRYELSPRVSFAFGTAYGSGLPVEFSGTEADAIALYGRRIVDHVNFERGRVRPSLELSASAAVVAWNKERRSVKVQVDAQNLTNRLNVINFAGLFSGTALAPPRSVTMRIAADF